MENLIRVQRGLLTDFLMSYTVQLPNYENDGGVEVHFPDTNMEDPESRHVTCIQAPFRANNYFQVTCDDLSTCLWNNGILPLWSR